MCLFDESTNQATPLPQRRSIAPKMLEPWPDVASTSALIVSAAARFAPKPKIMTNEPKNFVSPIILLLIRSQYATQRIRLVFDNRISFHSKQIHPVPRAHITHYETGEELRTKLLAA